MYMIVCTYSAVLLVISKDSLSKIFSVGTDFEFYKFSFIFLLSSWTLLIIFLYLINITV